MPRTLIVGDVHGCRDELTELLDRVAFVGGDRLVGVGDLVARGPDPSGVISTFRACGGTSARGNHDERILTARKASRSKQAPKTKADRAARETLRAMSKEDVRFLERLPLWIDLDDHGVRVVHAGLVPGIPIEKQDPQVLQNIRSLTRDLQPIEERGRGSWAEWYVLGPHVVFGHHALDEPQIHANATGLDTGAVYGGRLTGMLLANGQRPPPPADRPDVLVSVPARRAYHPR